MIPDPLFGSDLGSGSRDPPHVWTSQCFASFQIDLLKQNKLKEAPIFRRSQLVLWGPAFRIHCPCPPGGRLLLWKWAAHVSECSMFFRNASMGQIVPPTCTHPAKVGDYHIQTLQCSVSFYMTCAMTFFLFDIRNGSDIVKIVFVLYMVRTVFVHSFRLAIFGK